MMNTSNRFEPSSINFCFSASVIFAVEFMLLLAFVVAEFNSEPYIEMVPAKAEKSLLSVRKSQMKSSYFCTPNYLCLLPSR